MTRGGPLAFFALPRLASSHALPMIPEQGELAPAARRQLQAVAGLLGLAALVLWAVQVWKERFLSDDAFISFRYADHLSRGLGLVWNAGERVEGYTNFLWVLLMAAGLRLGIAPEIGAQVLGIASGLALLGCTVWSGGSGPPGRLRGALLVLYLAAHGSFGAWCTSGLETMFFTLCVWLATWRFLAERRTDELSPFGSAAVFALAALTRPEGGLFAGLAGLLLLADVARGRARLRTLVTWGLAFALPVGGHFLWRRAYYGEWLPNTFHAKVPGTWIEQGVSYLLLYERHYHALLFVPLLLLAFLGRRKAEAALLLAGLASYLAYVVAVGGDRFEFRFLVVVLPHFTWLVVEGAWSLALAGRTPAARRVLGPAAAALLLAFLIVTLRGYPPRSGPRRGVATVESVREYARQRAYEGRFLRSYVESGVLPEDLVLCVGGAGAVPYYTRWTTVDRRGLNDAWIAHERDAPREYLVRRRVAVFDWQNRLILRRKLFDEITPSEHDGHPLALRAIRLGEMYFAFATFVSDDELARLFPGQEILTPAPSDPGSGSGPGR